MKRALFLIALLTIMITGLGAGRISLGSEGNSLQVLQSNSQETILHYQIQHFDTQEVQIRGSSWHHINLPKEGITQDKGLPALPVFNRSITIDGMAKMKLEIFDIEYTDLKLAIAPSKGVIYRNIDPATVPYEFDPIYQGNRFYPEQIASLSEPYILRDFRGITIKTIPFAYQPSTGILRVYTAYKVRVYQDGRDTLNTMSQSRDSISRDFAPLYENHFVNWQNQRYTPVSDSFGKLLVICHTNYMSTILPYVNWKIQKGIPTELVQWSTIGTTAAQLQTYIKNRYIADPTIAYVQLVGDAPQIPSLASGGGGSDPSFSLVAGTDNYPDIFIGRFSAETTAQVTTQINKAIVYERDVSASDTWLSKALGIASAEGGSGGDDGESDIQHMNNIRTKLLNYGYSSVDQIYDPGASASTVTTNVNSGRSFINYVGHGSGTSWSTTGFNSTNATNLSNGSKTPFIVDVACLNGNFVSGTCFAEAWLRSANGGAVAMYSSSINQSWAPPMRAQDEITDLLRAETKYTIGGLYYNGSCNMMDVYGSSGVDMFKTWHIFGDASLMARSKTPVAMTVTHPNQIIIGASNMTVNTGVANALVALSYNNQLYARGFTNSSGTLTLPLSGMPAGSINYTLTVTAHNRVTYIGTVQQIPGTGPYVTVENIQYADGNNQAPDFGDSASFNVSFKNIGAAVATNLNATLSTTSPGITITDATEALGNLAAGGSITRNNAFAFNIANNVANGTVADFSVTMESGTSSWTHEFPITLNAPVLSFGAYSIADPSGNNNGMLDPGETVSLTMPILNGGGAASPAGSATLTSSTTGISITSGSASFSAITAGGSRNLSFNLSVDSSMAAGALASLNFSATAGAYSASKNEALPVGDPEQITIGSETSQQQHPLNRYYTYSGHEAIYLAGEIGMAGAIKSMAYYKASGTDENPIEAVTVYMKNTTATSLASGNYSTSGYTQVFSGAWPNTSTTGWMEVELNQRFAYDGMSNLSILIVKGNQYWTSGYPEWSYSSTGSTTRVRQNQNDSYQPTSLTSSSFLPNLRLKIYPAAGELYPPRDLAGSATHGAVTLTWQAPVIGSPTAYKIYKNNSALTTVTALTYRDAAVTDGNSYSYKVTALYGSDESEATETVSATPNMYAPSNLVAIGGNSVVQLSWNDATGRESDEAVTLGAKDRLINSYKIYKDGVALTTVNGNSYTDNAVTNGTAYSYHVTTIYTNPAGESAASNTATATPNIVTEVIIGSGTSVTSTSEASPLNIYYRSMHGQSVYTAVELNAAGMIGAANITQIGFYVNSAPAQALPSFIIRMKHTSESNVANWQTLADMQTVYSNASYMPGAGGYQMLTLNTPFLWNGVDNIVIDTAFDRLSSYNSSGTTQYTSMSNGYRYARSDGADQTNVFTGSSTSSSRPNVKLLFVPVSQDYAAISVNPGSISETVSSGSGVSRQITISNTGTDDLNWSIPERSLSSRNITGSTFTCNTDTYVPGSTATWTFTMTNATTDAEWIKDIQIAFPPTVNVTSVGSFVGGANPLLASPQNGTGVTINWHYESSYGYGGIQAGQTASATVNVAISAAASGNLSLHWIVTGDDYGSEPHSFSGNHVMSQAGEPQPDDWYTLSSHSGIIAPGTDAIITVLLDSEGLADGTYNSSFTIESNSMFNSSLNIPVSLTVLTPVNPYPTEPRFVAEWEPAQGAVVRYPFGQPYSLLRDLSNEALLYVIVSSSNQSTATSNLQSNSVNMANVRYVNAATDSYWTRDYAPWTILDAEHNMHLVDFNYNRPRPNDNLIPSVLASHLNLNLYDLDINHTGGNMMTDGMGKAMSTTLVLSENSSLSQSQINQRFMDILGVTDYFMYADPLANSNIDHIDCHAKLLDVDKVMIARVPSTHANYAALEATTAFWQSKTSSYGSPYQIFRVDAPNNEPYANSFILNKKIFVPQANSTPSSYDTAAIAAYQAAMPGYIVQGYYESSFLSDDAVHCRVNTIFDSQMISVRHQPVSDLTAYQEYTLTVEIAHVNALNPTDSFIAWSTSSSGPWQYSSLSHSAGSTYSASLSTAGHLQNIYYWIQAKDSTGRITTLPLCAGLDPFVASVTDPGSLDAPVVTITQNGSDLTLTWDAITGASSYRVESSNDPYTNFSIAGSTANTTYSIPATPARKFFRVYAVTDPVSTKH